MILVWEKKIQPDFVDPSKDVYRKGAFNNHHIKWIEYFSHYYWLFKYYYLNYLILLNIIKYYYYLNNLNTLFPF